MTPLRLWQGSGTPCGPSRDDQCKTPSCCWRLQLRAEMPAGEEGDRLTIRATVVVVIVVAQVVYGSLGVFGAARHGLATAGNILGNQWLPARAQV